jgi:hypothetical protein
MEPAQLPQAAASARERAPMQLSALPLSCLLLIFARVPADARLRCSEVCRAWRAAVADPSVWRRVDLSPQGGVAFGGEALLRAAVARARGGLQALDASGQISHAALFAAVAANAGSLLSLRVCDTNLDLDETLVLLGTAPALRELDADVKCAVPRELQRVCAVLRSEPPFERLRVRTLSVNLLDIDDDGDIVAQASAADVLQLVSAISVHAPLIGLCLDGLANLDEALSPAMLDAVISAALSRRLSCVRLQDCCLGPASALALARLLGGDALTELVIYNSEALQLFDADATVSVACALRANATLTSLKLEDVDFWGDAAAAETLLDALQGHVSLRVLDLSYNEMLQSTCKRAGYSLAKLVAANSLALRDLSLRHCGADEVCLNPVFQALPYNAHLRMLECTSHSAMLSEQFAGAVVLPTVRANASLKLLAVAADKTPAGSALRIAEALVAARRL